MRLRWTLSDAAGNKVDIGPTTGRPGELSGEYGRTALTWAWPGPRLLSSIRPMKPSRFVLAGLLGLVGAYLAYLRSDAHRQGNRLFYREGRPNAAGRMVGRAWVGLLGRGLGPSWAIALETTGRRSGRVSSIPLVVGELDGRRYLVSMLGERSPWVHNVRAAGGRAVIRRGRRQAVRLVEVPPAKRAPVIKAYLARAAGARPHIPVDPAAPLAAFEAVAADYPVFRIEEE